MRSPVFHTETYGGTRMKAPGKRASNRDARIDLDALVEIPNLPVDLVPPHKVIDAKCNERPDEPYQEGIAVLTNRADSAIAWRQSVAVPAPVDNSVASTSSVPPCLSDGPVSAR